MTPIDYRNAIWEEIAARLNKDRQAVYNALLGRAPSTTRELAAAMEWDILNVRPRVTELFQLGFVILDPPASGHQPPPAGGREGVYRALSWSAARHAFERRKAAAAPTQLTLL